VTSVNVDRIRHSLIQWIVQCQIPFRGISNEYFQELLLCLQPSLGRYIPTSHQTIADWVKEDFLEAKIYLNRQLLVAKSQIHLSFDIWTSPACRAIIGVCAHFLAPNLTLSHALLAIKEIEGLHSGENIASVISQVIQDWELQDKVGVFIGDNAGNIDTAVECLVSEFWPNEVGMEARRARCFAHIINLAAKDFLFGKNCEAFVTEMNDLEQDSMNDEAFLAREQERWRRQGVIGKFHNICRFIRQNPQRRQEFTKLVQATLDSGNKSLLLLSSHLLIMKSTSLYCKHTQRYKEGQSEKERKRILKRSERIPGREVAQQSSSFQPSRGLQIRESWFPVC
jgi:hypothetical protein